VTAYPNCLNRPTLSTSPQPATGALNAYVIWYNNASFPWTTPNKNEFRALLNNIQSSPWWGILRNYPDAYGRVATSLTVAGECDDPETEGNLINCIGGAGNTVVANHLTGGSASCTFPPDPQGVYIILPSWQDVATSGSCHSGFMSGSISIQTTISDYTYVQESFNNILPYATAFFTQVRTNYTQPSFGSNVVVPVNSISGMVVGNVLQITHGGYDYYTIASVTGGGSPSVTLTNNVAFIGSEAPGTTITAGSQINDMPMLPGLGFTLSHELSELITNPTTGGWACPGHCSNAWLTACTVDAACSPGTCEATMPGILLPGELEVADGCEAGYPAGWLQNLNGNPVNWTTTVGGTTYGFVLNEIFNGGAGNGRCATSYVTPPFAACTVSSDCGALDREWINPCVGGICQLASCADGLLDGDESDVDCGGTCPYLLNASGLCASTKKCRADPDCNSDVCVSGVCN
jgi:hypothetical protein